MTTKLLALSILMLASIANCAAIEPNALLKNMPASYVGTYVWQESGDTWSLSVTFSDRQIGRNGDVEFLGTEYFVHASKSTEKFESKVRAVVNARTFAFDMTEIDNQGKKVGFTPMFYTGKISSDLRTIEASWTGEGGRNVTIKLTAERR